MLLLAVKLEIFIKPGDNEGGIYKGVLVPEF